MVPSAKDLQSVEEIAMTFPTQIRYLTETETQRRSETETDREATLACGSNPLKLQIRQIAAQLSHFYINTAQGVTNAGREANVSNVASESLLSRWFFSSSLL